MTHRTPKPGNSFGDHSPELIKEWSSKNELSPFDYCRRSNESVWWICPKGHKDYLKTCDSRVGRREGCPTCSHKGPPPLEESLGFKRADLIFEWSEENEKSIWEVWPGNHYDARWKCLKCSRRWEAPCYSRYSNATGCPHCFKLGQSHIENEIRKSLVIYGALPTTVKLGKWEVDIYIPEKKIVIEYDGDYFHSNPKRIETDTRKSLNLLSLGYKVIRIRDSSKLSTLQISSPNYYEIDWKYKKTPDKELLDKLLEIL